ncbi:hypothetical protein CYMTET_52248 [Cymbomonas tetramitiformis]|uniref:Uncharacterized protein n=1 Tax=Cymbomonas tetramitiformis TaxID=36881 RepID=A0AAE0ERA2_9CHLO|nr:hypothetical protein CYMTET_52248 [Cymbomonas tetramitiformis]
MADTPSTEVMNPWEQSTQLHDAASAGDLAAVQSLIARGANVNTLNMHERTPLFLAAVGRHVEVVNTLLSCGLVNDVSPRDECGSTPLQWAVRIGAVEVVSALLKAGADVGDATDENNWTALHEASQQDLVDMAALLMAHGALVTEQGTCVREDGCQDGRTPMHIAIFCNHHAVLRVLARGNGARLQMHDCDHPAPLHMAIKYDHAASTEALIEAGADLEGRNLDKGMTALHLAASYGHTTTMEILLRAGADVTAVDRYGETPLHSAARNGHAAVSEILLRAGADMTAEDNYGKTPLHSAAGNGHAAVLEFLLRAGADVNSQMNGWRSHNTGTPLHWAAGNGHIAAIEILLQAGADMAAADKHGNTPLHWAAEEGHIAASEALFKAGFSLDIETPMMSKKYDRNTLLHFAAEHGYLATLVQFVQAGADVDAPDPGGDTPLCYAAFHGQTAFVEALLQVRCTGGLRQRHFRKQIKRAHEGHGTPLHWAALNGNVDTVKALLQAGVAPNAKNVRGDTSLHWAAYTGETATVQALLQAGADADAQDVKGITPLCRSLRMHHTATAEALVKAGAKRHHVDEDTHFDDPLLFHDQWRQSSSWLRILGRLRLLYTMTAKQAAKANGVSVPRLKRRLRVHAWPMRKIRSVWAVKTALMAMNSDMLIAADPKVS